MKLMELYQDKIVGAIGGLDRIHFRGTRRWLATQRGLGTFMSRTGVLLKDFSSWVNGLTARIRDSAEQRARELGIEVRYLARGGVDKESLAREIAQAHGITQGSICLLSVVEPCTAPMVNDNQATRKLEVVMVPRKCVWLYHYFDDPVLGFGHVRLQSWVVGYSNQHIQDGCLFHCPDPDCPFPFCPRQSSGQKGKGDHRGQRTGPAASTECEQETWQASLGGGSHTIWNRRPRWGLTPQTR